MLDLDQFADLDDAERRYLLGLPAQSSRERMRRALARLAQLHGRRRGEPTLDWATLTRTEVLLLVRRLDGMAPATARLLTSALRGVLREAGAAWPAWSAARPPRGASAPAGRALDLTQQRALLAACRSADRAMVALMLCGLRVGELVRLDVADVGDGAVLVRGKGGKQRRVALTPRAIDAVHEHIGDRISGPMFCTGGGDRMRVHHVQSAIAACSRRAGAVCTCHDLRRSAITTALEAGAPIEAIATHVGHASIETTRRYARIDPLAQSRAVAAALNQ